MKGRLRRRAARVMLLAATVAAALIPMQSALASTAGLASAAGQYTPIEGAGSSWAAVALTQWAQYMQTLGATITFEPNGSAEGRQFFLGNQVDFAASDPPFRNGEDPFQSGSAEHPTSAFSYVPDVAGGTAFMYHLDVGGKQIRNMRLSGLTIAKIFTGQITNWDNPEITHDYGKQLPSIPIVPVVRADGSGATYFFTRWMEYTYGSIWLNFCKQEHGHLLPNGTCPQTEFYPENWGDSVAQNGSEAVASYIGASYGQGAIGYDEYAYALQSNIPVVSVLNPGGYYVQPTASNVAVALTKAVINDDPHSQNYLQQNLNAVYTFTDPRSYPLSSYSYLIVPRVPLKGQTQCECNGFTSGAGRTLSTYIDYYLCAGQQYSAQLGYSPLPLELVEGGLLQASKIPGAIPEPSLSQCANPTLKGGKLIILDNAPYPSKCQKLGAPLSCGGGSTSTTGTGSSGSGGSSSSGTGSSGTGGSGNSGTNPATGGGSGTSGSGGDGTSGTNGTPTGTVVNLASTDSNPTVFGVLTVLEILAVIGLPPIVYAVLRRRRQARR